MAAVSKGISTSADAANPTPNGSINSNPQLALSQGYHSGNANETAQTNAKYATYLKLFSGEMIKAYESSCIAKGTVQNRTLRNGKSLQFIYTGRMTAEYHSPGTPILGSGDPPVAEKTILMDDLLISSAFLYDLDETLAHYSLRSEISAKIGHALAEAYDKKIFRVIAKSARTAHPITTGPGPEPGGSVIKLGAGNEFNAQALVDSFFEAASILDEKNVPSSGRTAVLSPRQYYGLISQVDSNILNRDYGNTQGNLNSGEGLYEIAGISIKRSNNLPFMAGTVARVNGENNDYAADFSAHCGLIYGRDAAAVVEAIGPSVQTTGGDVRAMYQGDMIIGRLAMGADWLNPAAAIELQAA
ncbi:MAG: T7 capsid protein [Cryomorphaceae bacterium]|nr:T7 capsid protein [Cryomorphaceae bacterium]|tara:strand:- start:1253 stop:2326 length:1074 start_codon:yes stop_codon:yes gene_type:complete